MKLDQLRQIIGEEVRSAIKAQMSSPTGGSAGLDLNAIPGFDLAKSKAILEAANKKDRTRHGK